MTCPVCHRPLTAPESLARGIGPVCVCKGSEGPMLFEAEEIAPDYVMTRGPDGRLGVWQAKEGK